jgi:hypothetical protein
LSSVADPGCLSRIPDPDFYPSRIPDPRSRIPDPKTATKERGEKKLDVKPFNVATKFNNIVNYFSFEVLNKKVWANFQRIIELFTKKIVKKLFKIWSWDPGSGIRDPGSGKNPFRIPDPGVKKAPIPDPGYGSATLLLRAEGFSYSLGVLYGGLGIRKLQFLNKKIKIKFPAVNLFHF